MVKQSHSEFTLIIGCVTGISVITRFNDIVMIKSLKLKLPQLESRKREEKKLSVKRNRCFITWCWERIYISKM